MLRGKHVLVQKPLTHTISEARLLTQTAEKYKIVTQMGNQGGSNQGVIRLKQWVKIKKLEGLKKFKFGRIDQFGLKASRCHWPMKMKNLKNWTGIYGWAPQPKDPLPRDYILLIGGVFGNMEQVHWEIWAAICLMHLIKPYS